MANAHPAELDLLDYVEGDIAADRRAAISAHVEGCSDCSATIRRLEAGRAALRAAPRLELPADRRRAIASALPERERRRLPFSPRLALAVLAPAAVAAVIGIAVMSVDFDSGMNEQAARGGEAAEATAPAADEEGERADTSAASLAPVASVEGPPRDVARYLRARGFDARVVDGRVTVADAGRASVRRALAERSPGAVEVVVE